MSKRPAKLSAVMEAVEGRTLFSVPTNPSFEQGLTGWTVNATGGPGTASQGPGSSSVTTTSGGTSGSTQALLRTNSQNGSPNGWSSFTGVLRSSTFPAVAGERLQVDWRVVFNSDDPIARGFLRRASDNAAIGTLFNGTFTGTTNYATAAVTVPSDGTYYFEFQGGSFDASRGGALGADLYVDNIRTDHTLSGVSAGGPYSVNEGAPLALSAAATTTTGGSITYSWDVNGDGTFGDATGQNPTLSWSQLNSLGITDGPRSITNVRVRASDSQRTETSAATTLTVNNVAPTATFRNAGPVNEASPVVVEFTGASDPSSPDVNAGLRYFISTSQAARNAATYATSTTVSQQSITFPDNGVFTVFGRVLDKDGAFTDYQTSVTVNNVNPVAVTDNASTDEDTTLTVNVIANDSDVAGAADPLQLAGASAAANGTVTWRPDGTVTYVPNPNFNGTDSFTYQLNDGDGGTATGTVSLVVNAVNDAPSFVKGADQSSAEDAGPQTVPGWATAVSAGPANESGQSLQFLVTNSNNALFSVQPSIDPSGRLRYTPATDANGVGTVTVQLRDNGGTARGGSDTSTAQVFKITVTAVNDAPVTTDDAATTDEDVAVKVDVLANDRPGPATAADEAGQALSVSHLNGVAVTPGATVPTAHGAVTLNGDGTVTYTPAPDYNGPDNFTYTAADDGTPRASSMAGGTVTINPVNDRPVAFDAAVATDEDTAAAVQLAGDDGDPEVSQVLTYSIVSGPTHGTVSDFNAATGTFRYTPNAEYNGPDSVRFTVTDDGAAGEPARLTSAPALVSIDVRPVNDAPVAAPEAYRTDEDTPLTVYPSGGLLANDYDVDGDLLTAVVVTGPTHGSLSLNADGSFLYIPGRDFNGRDRFVYRASDGTADSAALPVELDVTEVNDAPVVLADSPAVLVAEGDVAANTGRFSDVDFDAVTLTASAGAVTADAAAGTWSWSFGTADGPDDSQAVTITADDGRGGVRSVAFDLTVDNVAPAVSSDADRVTVNEGQTARVSGTWSDRGNDDVTLTTSLGTVAKNPDGTWGWSYATTDGPTDGGPITVTATDSDGAATVTTFDLTVNNVDPTVTIDNSGPVAEASPVTVRLTNADDASAADEASLRYFFSTDLAERDASDYAAAGATASRQFVFDDNGRYTVYARVLDKDGGFTDYQTDVTVNNVAPAASLEGAGIGAEGTEVSLAGSASDPSQADTGAGFVFAWTVTKNGSSFSAGSGADVRFTPDDNGTYVVGLTATDKDRGVSGVTTRTVTVSNVAPTANAGADRAANEGDTVNLAGTFTDVGSADTHTYNWHVVSSNGQVIADGSGQNFSFVPVDNGTYTATFTVTDDDGGSSSDTAVITVNNVAPVASGVSLTPVIDEGGVASLKGNIVDPSSADSFELTVNWGEGDPETFGFAAGTSSFEVTHRYADDNPSHTASDTYSVRATLTDDDGGSTSFGEAGAGSIDVLWVGPHSTDWNPGIYHITRVTSADFATQSLDGFEVIYVDASANGLSNLMARASDVAAFVNAGGGLVTDNGGNSDSPDFSWVPHASGLRWQNEPLDSVDLTLLGAAHPVTAGTTNAGLSGWDTSQHVYFTSIAGLDVLTTNPNGSPDSLAGSFGAGRTVYFGLDPSFHQPVGDTQRLIRQAVAWVGAQPLTVQVVNRPPVPTIVGAPASGEEGSSISLTSTVTDPGTLDTHTYAWSVTKNGADYDSGTDADFTFTPDDNGQYVVTLTVTDDDAGVGTDTETIAVTNVKPSEVAVSLDHTTINEDGSVTVSGSFVDPGTADTHGVTVDWGDGSAATVLNFTQGERTFSATHRYLDDDPTATASDVYTVSATVADDEGGSASASTAVTVNNVAPTMSNVSATAVVENGVATLSGTITDPGTRDAFALVVDWGDGATQTFAYAAGTTSFSEQHQYLDDNPTGTKADDYAIGLTLTDDDGGGATAGATVRVTNAAPTITAPLALSNTAINENGTVRVSGSYGDVGTKDAHTVRIDWGDGTWSWADVNGDARTFSATHQYLDDKASNPATAQDDFTITATVTDDDTDSASASTVLTVRNVAPATATMSWDGTGVRGQSRGFTVNFGDVGTLDTHTVSIKWGDTTPDSAMTVVESGGSGAATASHVYTANGTYHVVATVTDDDGGSKVVEMDVVIGIVQLQGNDLVVGGTTGNDTITFTKLSGGIGVLLNNVLVITSPVPTGGRLIAYGQAGDDVMQGTPVSTLVTELYGDAGNDQLMGGGGPSLLVGGDGNDKLTGNAGRSVQVGGAGADSLSGAGADDLLIGDVFAGDVASLRSVLSRWADPSATYGARTGPGSAIRADLAKVVDDGAVDVLTGNGGSDWFFSAGNPIKDTVKDRASTEVLN